MSTEWLDRLLLLATVDRGPPDGGPAGAARAAAGNAWALGDAVRTGAATMSPREETAA